MPSTKTGLPTPSAYKHVDNDGNRVVPPPSASAGPSASQPTTKKRGRPPRAPSPTPRSVWESMAAPRYVPFLCEWAGCKAELQNIGTLRRHLRKVHTREGGGGVVPACRWAGCGGGGGGKEEEEETLKFERVCELDEHVDRKHLLPFVWFVGDGVRNDKLVIGPGRDREKEKEEVPAYLLGADGAQVTPWVRDQQVEDFATFKANRRRLKAILLQRDANAPSIVDEEEHA
ncbi:hypothetical protein M406DRAFT_346285 [Cryphonectria parasitica EP155]|uniref:C2H2-type domain-containing protein n=1 Tax=Cryphonectria parasitica (strain ATCC 38755 / EP155) TaxID=660469 RepID=A0A9P4Y3L5_CRYP1|nr:uncharacterized protein M406DRAFT_346285 [Cryphonectria parasitica EP155]KAF3766314.1 hypothetical protein M406DRAFT_346285 [Cryphonectria parasitica EP155]